jgi:hypothetical protein
MPDPSTLPSAALRSWREAYVELQSMPADHPQRPDVIAHLRDCQAIMAGDPETAKKRAIWQRAWHRRQAEKAKREAEHG